MSYGPYFFFSLFVVFPLITLLVLLLILGIYALAGNSVADLFSVLSGQGAKLTCWHCGQETPANRKTCRHCGKELQ